MTGNIFNIQKFSIHDGPGVRTTVFFKGCPLRCRWCANPESQSGRIQITYDPKQCMECRNCVAACKQKAISYDPDRKRHILIDREKCAGCFACVEHCMTKALKAEGEYLTPEEVVNKCLQDMVFYEESGGGVTLSGGECFSQPEFAAALVDELKKHRIHVAAETTGCAGEGVFHELAPKFDLLLFDVKHYDSEKHREGTGMPNELILKNLSWAVENALKILVRIPVIPGFNDSHRDAEGLARLLRELGISEIQLLPFHQFGERKYELLNREYDLKDVKALHPEDLTDYKNVFTEKGLNCFI